MVQIPVDVVTEQDLAQWFKLQQELKALKASEMLLRQRIFRHYFKEPREGTNTAPLADDWLLKGTYTLNREIDPGTLAAMGERFVQAGVSVDKLVEYKPSLVLREYRTLTEEQRKLFDQTLVIKPGAPALEITLPAKAKKAGEKT